MMNLTSSFDTSKSSDPILREVKSEKSRRLRENRLSDYRPYPKQAAFHATPGQSGNPRGRPKGSRNKLQEMTVEKLCTLIEDSRSSLWVTPHGHWSNLDGGVVDPVLSWQCRPDSF